MNTAAIYNNVPTPSCSQTPLSVATPDGGILYTGFRCINYIAAPAQNDGDATADEVKTMSTRITVSALDVSPLWGQKQHNECSKQFAIVAEDLSVQVWDCSLGESIMGHKAHQHQHEARDVRMYPMIKVLMGYICNGNILSMDASDLVIYCVASNTYCRRPTFISPRNHQLTVLSCSPYNENLFALGTSSGFVMVCDMRKMSIVYKFSCQQSSICGLAWREMTFARDDQTPSNDQWRNTVSSKTEAECMKSSNDCDDFVGLEKPTDKEALEFEEACKAMKTNPKAKAAHAKEKSKKHAGKAPLCKSKAAEADDIFDIYNTDHIECEFGAPSRRQTAKQSTNYSDDFVGLEKPVDNAQLDFMEACRNMKAEMKAHLEHAVAEPQVEVTLADCLESGVRGPRSDSSNVSQKGDNTDPLISESSEGSLEVIQFSSSSDDAVIVDGEAAKPKREVLHHIYHQAEVHETPKSLDVLKSAPQLKLQPSIKLVKEAATIETISVASTDSSTRPDILLVSVNDNDVIMIWNTLTGAHCGKTYSKGNAAGKSREVHWLNDNIIVSLCRNQLVYWSFDFEPKQRRYKLQKDHVNKCSVQDIITIAPIASNNSIWMSLRNRRVGILNPKNGLLSAVYGTLAFGVRAIAECPDDMNKIALGCSDKRVALFDLSKLRPQYAPIESVHVNSIVYSLAWSPDCLQLAFGTYDGIVGIIDVDSMRVKSTFRSVHKKEVYSLMWQANYIYFVVNRVLGVYTANQPHKDAFVFTNIERPSYMCVRDAFLFVGTEDGFLQLYERKPGAELAYTSVRQTALLARYVTDIAFNPLQRNQFAVVGHDKQLHIMEFQPQQRGWSKQLTLTANDSKASITSVKWSNMEPHLLLSFHIEGKVCLWNLKELSEPPLTISYHCPMWCGMFLPTDESVIMSGGKALSLELISIKDALAKNEKNICCKSDALLKVKWASKSMTQPQGAGLNAAQKKRLRRDKRKAEAQLHSASGEQPLKTVEQQAGDSELKTMDKELSETLQVLSLDAKKNSKNTKSTQSEGSKAKELDSQTYPDNFMAHSRTCLCLTQKELNKYALEKLAIVLTEDAAKIDKSVLMSKLFSTKVMAKDLIATELTNLKQSNNKDIAPLCLSVSTFKVRDELQQHIENKTLNEWHLSLAPAVSYVFWQKCCKAYALQMEEKGFIVHAATYLGAIDMHTDAINLLLKHEYFKEALAHARIHLPATDPMIKTIINNWLEQLEKTGNFAAAALICVLDNEMLRGFSYLRKFRNCTPEIADLMEQIKRIGQLGSLFEDSCMDRAENGGEKELKEEAN